MQNQYEKVAAERVVQTRTKTITVTEEVPSILLKLDVEVAETILLIANSIGGCPTGRRGHVEKLRNALKGAGIRHDDEYLPENVFQSKSGHTRSLYFKEGV